MNVSKINVGMPVQAPKFNVAKGYQSMPKMGLTQDVFQKSSKAETTRTPEEEELYAKYKDTLEDIVKKGLEEFADKKAENDAVLDVYSGLEEFLKNEGPKNKETVDKMQEDKERRKQENELIEDIFDYAKQTLKTEDKKTEDKSGKETNKEEKKIDKKKV